jgi:hypothetical protein
MNITYTSIYLNTPADNEAETERQMSKAKSKSACQELKILKGDSCRKKQTNMKHKHSTKIGLK